MYSRDLNLFEKALFAIAGIIALGGFWAFYNAGSVEDYIRLMSLFSLITAIVILILAAAKENMKKELSKLIEQHVLETKVLKNTHDDVLAELKLLREDQKKHHKK